MSPSSAFRSKSSKSQYEAVTGGKQSACFMLVSFLAYSVILKMEATSCTETSIEF
jgi:hypothetical protein